MTRGEDTFGYHDLAGDDTLTRQAELLRVTAVLADKPFYRCSACYVRSSARFSPLATSPTALTSRPWALGQRVGCRWRAGRRGGRCLLVAECGAAGKQVAVGAEVHRGCGAGGELPCVCPAWAGVGALTAQDPGQCRRQGVRVLGRDEDAAAAAQGPRQAIDRRADDRDPEPERHHGALRPGFLP